MKIIDLFENDYPFGVALPIRRPDDKAKAKEIFDWVVAKFGASAPMPEILVADHEKMQWAAQRANHHTTIGGQIYGWYSQEYPNKLFLSSRASLKGKTSQAVLAHELTHYLQDNTDKHADKKPFTHEDVEFLEQEADDIMAQYLKR